ncbi:MAG: alanine racemase, partial [Ilumatobacteraceae bacterium]
MNRASVVEIDPGAIAHNVAWVKEQAEGERVLAGVKADGYGHGAVTAAEAA